MDMTRIYGAVTGAGTSEVGRGEAGNGAVHVVSLSMTKSADGLIDPKLVLSWLLNSLGAPAAAVGALVPVREAGALLPQLALSRVVERTAKRKLFWAAGSAVQGVAALAIALAAFTLEGAVAGWTIVGALAVLALGRSMASISYKDALARTIPKRRRGSVTGVAASIASAAVLLFGALLALGIAPLGEATLAAAVALAGCLWLGAAALFLMLDEKGEVNGTGESVLTAFLGPLRNDPQLRRFIAARALLAATALAPPFIVMLSAEAGRGALDQLGPLVLASGAASIVSAWVWGRLSDRSSRQTLMAGGALGAVVFAGCAATGYATGGLGGAIGAAAAVFLGQIAYQGVRSGRKIHLTDMVGDDSRARYTAISNSIIGVALILGGGFGWLADAYGPELVLAIFAGLAACGAALATGLNEVQREG